MLRNRLKLSNRKGQSILETALVLPLVLFIVLGMITLGIYIYDLTLFTLGANKSLDTAVGLLGKDDYDSYRIESKAESEGKNFIGNSIFVTSPSVNVDVGGSQVTVTIKGTFDCKLPLVSGLLSKIAKLDVRSVYVHGD